MLDAIIKLALRQRILVLALAVMLLGAGSYTAMQLPVDVFPDLNRPTVTVMTEAGGLSPEEVEVLVTRPIETAMNGAPGVDRVRSSSAVGLSIVWIEFGWSTSLLENRQRVNERLGTLSGQLPTGMVPTMGPITSIMGEIMLVGVVSDAGKTAPVDLRTLADFTIGRQLQAVPGVAQVIAIGGGRKVLRIAPRPARMAALGITLEQLTAAAHGAQTNTTGGFVERQGEELLIRNLARTSELDLLADTVVAVAPGGVTIRLRDVADLGFEAGVKRGDAGVNGQPAVILAIQKQPGSSTAEVTAAIDATLADLGAHLASDVHLVPLFRQAEFIHASTENVAEALRDGALLVVIVLILFLQNLRTTFITLTAIPLSLAVTALVFSALGISVNTMTLGGVAVAIGELVDDAIVDVENVFRRLRENRAKATPEPVLEVVWRASREVRGSIVFATMLVVLVFVPLFALGGIEGRLFAPLGVAYIVSILASLAVSITVTPALASLLLPRSKATAHTRDGLLVRGLKRLQRGVLVRTLAEPWLVLGTAGVLVLTAVGIVSTLGTEFLPAFNEGTATINLMARPGIGLGDSDVLARAAEKLILQVPEVKSVGRRTGRAEQDEHAEGVHYTEIDVDFHAPSEVGAEGGAPQRPREVVLAEIRDQLARLPGVVANIGQPISHRLDHLLSGVRAEIAIKIRGPGLAELRRLAVEIEGVARAVPGLVDVQAERLVLVPQLRLHVKNAVAARYGFAPGALAETLETLLDGEVTGQILEEDRTFEMLVRLADATRADPRALAELPLDTPSGAVIPLGALVDIRDDRGPNQILHENAQRRIAVLANVEGRDLGSAVVELEAAVAKVALPPGYTIKFEGQFQSQGEATRLIGWLAILSLCSMVLVLWIHFRSLRLVAQVLLNIPLALIGSATALWLADLPLSVATLVGFITLCGIASRNSILLIDHYLLLAREGAPWSRATIVHGSLDRLVPVLMTALTAALGLIPLVVSAGAPGKEILHPVAVVILGGLVSSTFLDLLVTPAAFWLFGRNVATRAAVTPGPTPFRPHTEAAPSVTSAMTTQET